ncbi:MAG: hypothetical protein MR269_05555 [Clostridiales bacterium]|nr:hypothetical protein [Clostridiales bacterium]
MASKETKEIKTSTGFVCEINPVILDDMELLDALAEAEENALVMTKILNKVLGPQKAALYDHVRAEDGRVPIEAAAKELAEIFVSAGKELKNS